MVFVCCAGNKICKRKPADNMSLADRARARAQGRVSGGLFDNSDADDLELTWVQTDTGMVRTTRRRSDLIKSPLAGRRDNYRGIDSVDTVPSATPTQSGPGVGSAHRGSDPFSSEQPIVDFEQAPTAAMCRCPPPPAQC